MIGWLAKSHKRLSFKASKSIDLLAPIGTIISWLDNHHRIKRHKEMLATHLPVYDFWALWFK
jgi:hypothetical protein